MMTEREMFINCDFNCFTLMKMNLIRLIILYNSII